MIRNSTQNHTGSKPAVLISGVKIGTKMRTIEIQSRKNPAMKMIVIISDSSIQGESCISPIRRFAVAMPPAPMKTPVNSVPASSTVMIIVVTFSVLMIAS